MSWVHAHNYEVSEMEREMFNEKLLEVFDKRSVPFHVDDSSPEPFVCSLEVNQLSGSMRLNCGSFWNDHTNLIPIIAMTHELGHWIDLNENHNGDVRSYYKRNGTHNMEIRAWFYAVGVCRELGFTRWNVFFNYAKHCLGTYYKDPRYVEHMNKRFGYKGTYTPTFEVALEYLKQVIGEPVEELELTEPPQIHDLLERIFG